MRKEASTYIITVAILGAFGLLLRWLQTTAIFEPDSDLAAAAPISWLMGLFLAAVIGGIWWLSGRCRCAGASPEPEIALERPHVAVQALLVLAALVAAAGAALLFFQTDDILLKIAALAGLLAAPVLMLYPMLPGWGGIGAAFAVGPVGFFCLWMVVSYKQDAVNPVLWSYVVQILAVAASLYAVFQLCAYLFYRAKPRKAVFACGLAAVYCMAGLTDGILFSVKLLLGAWGVGIGTLGWVLISNFREEEENG